MATDLVQSIAAVATAVGVAVAASQLLVDARQRRGEFEQRLNLRYEEIQARIDLKYLIDGEPFDPEDHDLHRAMYDYFEFCEEEYFYVTSGRATKRTWEKEWWPGITANLDRPAFAQAWQVISPRSWDQFESISADIDRHLTERQPR